MGVSLTITPCWCYGSETMDMDPLTPKAVWGFNGTERPGAVYLAAVLAAHTQKGLPAFGIYGRDVQDANDGTIPGGRRRRRSCASRGPGLAAAILRGKSYLSLGGVSMGIAGSIVDQPFFEKYLGMRVEAVDMSELTRRLEEGIYDPVEFETALAWAKANCTEGADRNPPDKQKTPRGARTRDWETVVKMTLITRDLLVGNPRLAELGFGEEAMGRNAILGGFQGQRQWTDHAPNGDFMEAILNSSFDWNGIRAPHIFATENDSPQRRDDAALATCSRTGPRSSRTSAPTGAPRPSSASPGTGPTGLAADGFIHLINSGAATLDATGAMTDADGKPAMKPFWEITDGRRRGGARGDHLVPGQPRLLPGRRLLVASSCPGAGCRSRWRASTSCRGAGPVLQIAEGWTVELPKEVHDILDQRTDPTWPTHWFVPRTNGVGPFRDVYTVMANWAANHGAISYGHIGADLISLASILRIPVHMHNVPEEDVFRPSRVGQPGHRRPRGRGLPRLRQLRPALRAQVAPTHPAPPPGPPLRHRRGGGLVRMLGRTRPRGRRSSAG